MKISKILLPAFASLILFSSCKKSAVDNNALQYQIQTVNRSANINAPVAISNIQWTSGFAYANQIKLEGKQNTSEVEFKSNTSQRIDLFSSVAAALGNITIPAGTYNEVEFKIELNANGNTPVFELHGLFTNASGVTTPVIFTVSSLLEIKAEQANVTITDNSSTSALTTLDLSVLTTGVIQSLLNNATLTNGTIILSSSSNAALFNIILNNFLLHHEVEVEQH